MLQWTPEQKCCCNSQPCWNTCSVSNSDFPPLNCRGGTKKKRQLQHWTLCFQKLLSRHREVRCGCGHFCLFAWFFQTSQLKMARFQFCSICQSASVSMSIRDSEISEPCSLSFRNWKENLNRSWNNSQKTEFVYQIIRCLRWLWAGNRETRRSKITDSQQSIFNKNLARKSKQQSYPGLTCSSRWPKLGKRQKKCSVLQSFHLLFFYTGARDRPTQTLQRDADWSL